MSITTSPTPEEQLFMNEYKALVDKHKMALVAQIDVTINGIVPILILANLSKEKECESTEPTNK